MMHLTTYSVSDSVNSAGESDDLNNGPSLANCGIADNCSEGRREKRRVRKRI